MASEDDQIENYLTSMGWGKYQTWIFFISGTSLFNVMMWAYTVSLLLVKLGETWDLGNIELGVIGSLFELGTAIGPILFGYLADRYGRMFSFRLSIVILWFSTIFMVFSFNFIMLSIVLFFVGISAVSDQGISATILKEFIPSKNSSILAVFTLFYRVGGALIAVIIIIVELINPKIMADWRIISIIIFFWVSLQLIQRQFMDETPRYLFTAGKLEKAEEVLKKISIANKKSIDIQLSRPECPKDEITEIKQKSTLKILFIKENIRKTMLLTIIGTMISFANISIILYLPTFLKEFSLTLRYTVILIQQFWGVLGSFMGRKLVTTRFGKKWTLSLSSIILGFYVFFFLLVYEIFSAIAFISLYQFLFQISIGTIWIIVPESFSTNERGTFIGWFLLWQNMAGFVAPTIIGSCLSLGGNAAALSAISFSHLVAGLFSIFLIEIKLKKGPNLI